jgi:cell division protease FtsH
MMFNDVTTGAHDDLDKATKVARQMVCEYGMSDKLGPLTLGQKQDQVFLGRDFASHPDYSPEIAYEIDKEIRRMIDEAFKKAKQILTDKNAVLRNIAKVLIDRETIEKEELQAILDGKELPVKPTGGVSGETGIAVDKKPAPKGKDILDIPGKLRPAEG